MSAEVEAQFFDGRHARPQRVALSVIAGQLVATPLAEAAPMRLDDADAPPAEPAGRADIANPPTQPGTPNGLGRPVPLRWPLAGVRWPERTRHGKRVVHLDDGGQFEIDDAAAFDAWRAAQGARESWVVRAQQLWRATLTALVLLVALLVAGYRWGVPWTADALVALVPHQVDRAVGEAAFENLSERWLEPSVLTLERQQALRDLCRGALQATLHETQQRSWTLRFARGGKVLGANAFALPDGTIVITDELVALLDGHDDTLLGVFGHEYGHVHRRDGMRALARLALVSMATGVALGDFSTVLAGVPALLAQLGYSRDAEREADEMAARVLTASGRRPEVMTVLFERLGERRGRAEERGGLPIALASHPRDDERVRFFREYGQRRR